MADNYCKCKGCRHIDPNERSGYKWYCTWYRSYEDPDYVRECTHFESQNGGGCFLTTACCQYKGLPDNCAELTSMRAFRDSYLMTNPEGKKLVEEYYRIAPMIVEKLSECPEKDGIYESMYTSICSIVKMIAEKAYDAAINAYKDMVFEVQKKMDI